jgi:hypothetical protein
MPVELREDEILSKPLRVGSRPELPGLQTNLYWRGLLATHRPYSGRVASTSVPYQREQELLNEIMVDQIVERALYASASIIFLEKHQFNISKDRKTGGGAAACVPFISNLVRDVLDARADLFNLLEPESLSARLLREVRAFSASLVPGDGRNGGESPMLYMMTHCREFLDNSIVSIYDFVGDKREDMLRGALGEMVAFDRSALIITALPLSNTKAAGDQTGDTYTVLWIDPKFVVVETHRHFVCDVEKGALVAQLDDINSLVRWMYEGLLPTMRCSCEWFAGIRILPTDPKLAPEVQGLSSLETSNDVGGVAPVEAAPAKGAAPDEGAPATDAAVTNPAVTPVAGAPATDAATNAVVTPTAGAPATDAAANPAVTPVAGAPAAVAPASPAVPPVPAAPAAVAPASPAVPPVHQGQEDSREQNDVIEPATERNQEQVESREQGERMEPAAKKPRTRRCALVDADVAASLNVLIPQLQGLRAEKQSLVEAEDFWAADRKKAEVQAVGTEIVALPVCPCCFIEVPEARARERGKEAWRYQGHKMVCAHCGVRALFEFDEEHLAMARDSLRRRVRAEIMMIQESLPAGAEEKDCKALKAKLRSLEIAVGVGRGPRLARAKKDLSRASGHQQVIQPIGRDWLVGQVYRTLGRLLPESSLCEERAALLLGLRAYQAR